LLIRALEISAYVLRYQLVKRILLRLESVS
jgi:hypothetical protein